MWVWICVVPCNGLASHPRCVSALCPVFRGCISTMTLTIEQLLLKMHEWLNVSCFFQFIKHHIKLAILFTHTWIYTKSFHLWLFVNRRVYLWSRMTCVTVVRHRHALSCHGDVDVARFVCVTAAVCFKVLKVHSLHKPRHPHSLPCCAQLQKGILVVFRMSPAP